MIKEAINRILELAKPNEVEFGERKYVDKKVFELEGCRKAQPLELQTLSSFIDYIKDMSRFDTLLPENYIVNIEDHKTVKLVSCLNADRERETILEAKARTPQISFERFMDNERMIIMMISQFIDDPDTDRDLILKFAGTVTQGTIREYSDDGVTQQAVIKVGTASKANAIVPSPCTLKPYRTFIEVDQPASKFIFRMREQGGTVESALFEADGGAWKLGAMKNIAEYLESELKEAGVKVIW